jgi:hypothetical protein
MTSARTAAVVGFEAQLHSITHATWGTAAVRIGNELVNPTTQLRADIAQLDVLERDGLLSRFSREIPIAEEEAVHPLIVIAIRQESPYSSILSVEKNRLGGVVKRAARDKITFFVVRDREGLRQFSRDVAHRIIRLVFDSVEGAEHLELVRAGLVLDPAHPYLNAMRAYFTSGRGDHVVRLARACVKGHRGGAAFDEMLNALSSGGKEHVLEYEKGITSGGGLDINYAARILGSIEKAIKKLRPEVKIDFPFLPDVPFPRLHKLEPGSARLHFVAERSQEDELERGKIGERVARYLELRALERALQGDAPPDLADDLALDDALEIIARPAPNTSLRQKPFEKDEPEPVYFDGDVPHGDVVDNEFTVLGVFTGVFTEGNKLEARMFPGARGRLLLSTVDDGYGKEPEGLVFLQAGTLQLYSLAVLSLIRRTDGQRYQRFFLRGLRLLQDGDRWDIDAVPSSLVRGAFRFVNGLQVANERSGVRFGAKQLPPFRRERNAVYDWLREYRVESERVEVLDSRQEWLRAIRPPRPASAARAVVSLHYLGGESTANELAEEISRRFDTIARVNNTRREVIRNGRLLEFVGFDQKLVRLTEYGKAYFDAYLKAGGDTGYELGGESRQDAERSRPG